MKQNTKAVVVLGMPRSGASIIADLLTMIGLDSGTLRLCDDFANNDLTLAHEILMRDLGCKWNMIGDLPSGWQTSEAAAKAEKSIQSILEHRFAKDTTWVIHDPRICRFLPLWLQLFKTMNVTPALVVNVRHPLENARSLVDYDAYDLKTAFLLWLSTHRDIFSVTHRLSHLLTTFDQVLADPVSVLQYISRSLDLSYPEPIHKKYSDILEYIRPEMKHHHSSAIKEPGDFTCTHYIDLYEQIRRVCVEQGSHLAIAHDSDTTMVSVDTSRELLAILRQGFLSLPGKGKEGDRSSAPLFHDMRAIIGEYERRAHVMDLEKRRLLLSSANPGTTLYTQVYLPQTKDPVFSDTHSQKILLAPSEWQEIVIFIPDAAAVTQKGIQLSPLNIRGIVHISSIHFKNPATHASVLKLDSAEAFKKKFDITRDAFSLPNSDTLSLFIYDNNPRVMIRPLPDLPDCPLELRIWIKPEIHQKLMKSIWDTSQKTQSEVTAALAETRKQKQEIEIARKELEEQLVAVRAEKNQLEKQLEETNNSLSQVSASLDETNKQKQEIETARKELEEQLSAVQGENTELQKQLEQQKYLTLQYFTELSKADTQEASIQARVADLQNQLTAENRARKNLQQERDTLAGQFSTIQAEKETQAKQHRQLQDKENIRLLRQLENDVNAFDQSARWKVGNSLMRVIEFMLLRGKPKLALDHMQTIFKMYHDIIKTGNSRIDPYTMQNWMQQLETDFKNLLASRRWQAGNFLVRGVEISLFRRKPSLAVDHIRHLFQTFKENEAKKKTADKAIVISAPAGPPENLTPSPRSRHNILFVSHSGLDSNSGYHVQYYANQMAKVPAWSSLVAVPRIGKKEKPFYEHLPVQTYDDIIKNGTRFSDGRGPDIIHAWTPREHVRTFCLKLAEKYRCRTIIHLEDNEEYLTEQAMGLSWPELIKMPVDKLDGFITPNRFHPVKGWQWLKQADGLTLIIDTLSRFNPYGIPSMMLPAPVDRHLFFPRPVNHALRKELKIPEDHLVLVYPGNIRALKRPEAMEMYRAVKMLNDQGIATTLIRTGENFESLDEADTLDKRYQRSLGWVDRKKVPEILAAADILVQPGWPGPFDDQRSPAKLPEYFALGRPVVLPKTNFGRQAVHKKHGYVLDISDAPGIVHAVTEIRSDRNLYKTLSEGALEFFRNLPGNKDIIPALSDFYAGQLGFPADLPQQNQVTQLKRQLFQVQEMMEEYYFKYTALKEKKDHGLLRDNT